MAESGGRGSHAVLRCPHEHAGALPVSVAGGLVWHRALSRRSQNDRVNWERMRWLIDRWLPPLRIYHPYPLRRLGVVT
jgi:hypothetical protein